MNLRFLSAAAFVAVLMGSPPAVASAQEETPSASLDRGDAEPGGSVEVTGRSWPDGVVVQAQLCGNQALNGSVDCDRAGAMTVGVGSDGLFSIRLPVTEPPTPCPCVVLITSPDVLGTVLRLPLDVAGVPTAEPTQDRASIPVFSITGLRVIKERPVAALFGASHERSIAMTIENLGGTTIETLPITVTNADAPDEVIASGELADLQAGESTELRLDFPVSALARGTTTVNVTVDQSGQAFARSASFSTFPWGLLGVVLAVLALVTVLWGLHRRRRRRRDELVDAIAQPRSTDQALAIEQVETNPTVYMDGQGDPSGTSVVDRPSIVAALPAVSVRAERALSDDLARLIAATLRDIGSVPPSSDTDVLADRMAIVIVAELQTTHDFDPSAAVALTASIADELARELRQVAAAPT